MKIELNKKQKIAVSGFLIFLVILLIIYSAASYRFSKGSAISKLQKAVINNDAKTAATLIRSSDKKLVIDENNIKSFLKYLNKNPYYFKQLTDTLHKQASALDGKKNPGCWNCYLNLKKSGRNFLGFSTYYFEMKPCYADISTNYITTKIYVDGKYVFTAGSGDFTVEPRTCGPFVQGQHNIKAVCETLIGKSESSKELYFISNIAENGKVYDYPCSIAIADQFAYVFSSIEDAEIFINGKDTGKTAADIKILGPVDNNTSVTIYGEKNSPWGILRSSEAGIRSYSLGYDMNFSAAGNDKLLKQVKDAVADYNKKILCPALKSESIPSGLRVYSNKGTLESFMKKEYDYMSSKGKHFSGSYLYSSIKSENTTISYNPTGNIYYMSVPVTDYYDQDYGEGNDCIIKTSVKGITHNYYFQYDADNKISSTGIDIIDE